MISGKVRRAYDVWRQTEARSHDLFIKMPIASNDSLSLTQIHSIKFIIFTA